MKLIYIVTTIISSQKEQLIDNAFPWSETIIFGVIASLIAASIRYILKRKFNNTIAKKKNSFLALSKSALKAFKEVMREPRPPAVKALLATISSETIIGLTSSEGEPIILTRYGQLLTLSLNEELRECTFIAKTEPSDWYAPGDLGVQIREYFNLQCQLKSILKDKLEICRYLLLDKSICQAQKDSLQKLRSEHLDAGIHLFICDKTNINSTLSDKIRDSAFFKDENGLLWKVEGLDFEPDTISKAIEAKVNPAIKVRIEYRQNRAKIDNPLIEALKKSKIIKLDDVLQQK